MASRLNGVPWAVCGASSLGLLLSAWAAATAVAAPAAERPIDFVRDVYPILQRSCVECHGKHKQEGDLRLDERSAALAGGASGATIVPRKPEESELLRRVALDRDDAEIMPARGEPLSPRQVATLRRWIAEGAVWPERIEPPKHWAFVPPARPELPPVAEASWVRQPLDRFVLARLEAEGLRPAPEAERAVLLRRVYLDLIGLPPSPAEADAFLADTSPDAYERVVDRLLASPQFGERWARPWLDLARYADSHGFQRDDLRDIWPYRDWVIRALNADLPFDRFTIEQLAGDLLPKATVEQRVATGFHRATTTNVEAGTDQEENRVNQVFDRVNTTAAVWLGITMECAQCHDHKYDPISQREYYQLFAYFNNSPKETDFATAKAMAALRFAGPTLELPDEARAAARHQIEARVAQIEAQLAARTEALDASQAEWEQEVGLAAAGGQAELLEIVDFDSLGGANYELLPDGSVLLRDDVPDRDTYVVTARSQLANITAFKLETLTHESLPGQGPGRGDDKRPNFVLHAFRAAEGTGPAARPIKFAGAAADFSQVRFPPQDAIDDDPQSGWAINPQFGRDHWAVFETAAPCGAAEGQTFTFTLEQNFGGGRVIGRLRLSALAGAKATRDVPADVLVILRKPRKERTPAEVRRVRNFRQSQDAEWTALESERAEAAAELADLKPALTLVMQELPEPRATHILARGNFLAPGERVEPGVPAVLGVPVEGPPNRLGLAQWLVDRRHPLTARVTVNRWWAELFGQGLVTTPEDFGIKGELPTHPELLDWLAVELMEPSVVSAAAGGAAPPAPWSMKHWLRVVVTSATYRQSSRVTPELLTADDRNRLLARGPRFRLDAETIRDQALAVSGLLSLKQFGPPIRPYQPPGVWENKIGGDRVEYVVSPGEDQHRRGVYVVWKRGSPYPSFMNFDARDRNTCVVRRSRSNTPLQALTLLNDPVYVEAARALARRVCQEREAAGLDERLRHAFRLCLVREPRPDELAVLRRLFEAERSALAGEPARVAQIVGPEGPPPGVEPAEFAAWQTVAAALLNLDETVNKG